MGHMNTTIHSRFFVESVPDLWRAIEWADNTPAIVRVIQTCVGDYGAIDQEGGTLYFDVGDWLVHVFDKVVPVSEEQVRKDDQ